MDDKKYQEAKKRVRELKDFYRNLITYLAIILLLMIINLITSPGYLWFLWVALFWGIGIVLHASRVFILKGKFLGKEWEEKKIRKLIGEEDKE